MHSVSQRRSFLFFLIWSCLCVNAQELGSWTQFQCAVLGAGVCPCTDNQSSGTSWCRDPTPSLGSPPGFKRQGPGGRDDPLQTLTPAPLMELQAGHPCNPLQLRVAIQVVSCTSEHLVVNQRGSLSWILFISKATNKT